MNVVLIIVTAFIALDGLVWLRFHFLLGRLRRRRLWRGILALLMLGAVVFAVVLGVSNPTVFRSHRIIPQWIPAAVFIWHFLVLPVTVAAIAADWAIHLIRRFRVPRPGCSAVSDQAVSRRRFLTAAALAVPPVACFTLAGASVARLGAFRIKRYQLAINGWPAGLDGFTIAFVADVHAGVFSSQKMLDAIADATNRLGAELILLGGDLVNISHSDLPNALDMVRRLDSPNGLYMVQGNHDVIGGAERFNRACAARGVPLLLNDAVTLFPRGIPIQLLGTLWTAPGAEQHAAVRDTLLKRDPNLFPILLVHHPHAWDVAAENGIPLVLAGHTHGGQIMLTSRIGAGPLRFKYWSGLYQRDDAGSNLVVSNGVGDWFPLRINAPAEIVHLTLHPRPSPI
jgi:hypothetical protein